MLKVLPPESSGQSIGWHFVVRLRFSVVPALGIGLYKLLY